MKYLLDSDMVNILYDDTRKAHHDALHRRISKLTDEDVLQSSALVLCELEYSFYNAPDKKKASIRKTIVSVTNDFDAILPINQDIAPIFGELKALFKRARNLTRKDMRSHNVDLMLASTAIQTSFILIGTDSIYQTLANLNQRLFHEYWIL